MSEQIDREIRRWSKPIMIRVGDIEVRDCYRERNTPLVIEGDLGSYMPSMEAIRKEVKKAEPQRD
jgi:hypothetical protein